MTIARMKAAAHEAFITSIAYKKEQVHIEMMRGVKVDMEKLDAFLVRHMNNIRVVAGAASGFVMDMEKKSPKKFICELEAVVQEIRELLESTK